MDGTHKIQALGNGFQIVETMAELQSAGVSEIAHELDLPPSTVYDYLNTLHDTGYVLKQDGEYRLSTRFLEIGGKVRHDKMIYHIARPELRTVANNTGYIASLVVEENDYAIFLYSVEGEYTTRAVAHDGSHTWLHTNAPGKAILAYSSEDRVEKLIDQYGLLPSTERTITDPGTLYDDLDEIRERGYALDEEEAEIGLQGIAKPIRKGDGDPLGAVSVYGGARRSDIDQFIDRALQPLERAIDVIGVNVSYELSS